MQIQLTAVFRQTPKGYIAFVEELPGANTQGSTLEAARANLPVSIAAALGFRADRPPGGYWAASARSLPF